MALERQNIEKKDFPIGDRGYEPEAVDAHLKTLADQVEQLQSSARRRSETLASAASDQVRAIVEAAEQSAALIQRQAEEEAQEIRTEASSEAQSTRDEAAAQAREYVSKLSESSASMLQRLDAMEGELAALVESLRTGSTRLNADLALLETNLADVRTAVAPGEKLEPVRGVEPERDVEPERGVEAARGTGPGRGAGPPRAIEHVAPAEEELPAAAEAIDEVPAPGEAMPVLEEVDEPLAEPAVGETATAAGGNGSDDTEGARLIALNMALNGTPRAETDRYLADNFKLADRAGLLDEVYASVGG